MFLKQEKPEMDNFDRKQKLFIKFLTETLAKIFLHILLFKKILSIVYICKQIAFLAAGGREVSVFFVVKPLSKKPKKYELRSRWGRGKRGP